MLFKLFGTPILKYTNIDYQCVTNLSPKSDEDRRTNDSLVIRRGYVPQYNRKGGIRVPGCRLYGFLVLGVLFVGKDISSLRSHLFENGTPVYKTIKS